MQGYYSVSTFKDSKLSLSYETLSALSNFKNFREKAFSLFKDIESGLDTVDRPFSNSNNKFYFQIWERTGTTVARYNDFGEVLTYYQRKNSEGALEEKVSFTLDFATGMSSSSDINFINLMRLYTSLLAGYIIKISTDSSKFSSPNRGTSTYLVAEITRAGCRFFNRGGDYRLVYPLSDNELKINTFIDKFFKDTKTVRTLSDNSNHLMLPYSTPITFFELLFVERDHSHKYYKFDLNKKIDMINKYVNFEILNNIMQVVGDEDYDNWKTLYELYKKRGGLSDIKDLKTFVDLFVDIRDKSNNIIEYIPENFYDYELFNFEIHPDFSRALHLSKFL